MNRHSFRWEPLVYGLLFLAAVGQWAVWKADLLRPDQLAYVAAGVLIALGVIGIIASLAPPRQSKAPSTVDAEPAEEVSDVREEADQES